MKKFYFTFLILLLFISNPAVAQAQKAENNKSNDLLYDFHDNGEWHEDFAISEIEGWIMVDEDGHNTTGPTFNDFPNKDVPKSFILYNPSQTDPENTFDHFQPRTGSKSFMSISSDAGPVEDWMITNELASHPGGVFSFYAKGTSTWAGNESFKVAYSTTGTNPDDFIFFNDGDPIEATFNWAKYQYEIPSDAKHLAIICVSYTVALIVDDIEFKSNVAHEAPAMISGFSSQVIIDDQPSVEISWTNPDLDAEQNPLTELSGVKVYRGSHPMSYTQIADITTAEIGESSQFVDTDVELDNHYSYRLVGYNNSGEGEVWSSDFLFVAMETTPGAPNEIEFSRNEENQTVISWNEVNYGIQGGPLLDPVTGYTIERKLGDQSETLATMHPDTIFTETDNPGLNLYTYKITAHVSETEAGPPAVRHKYSGMSVDQEPVTNGVFESNQVFELTRQSILSQSIYKAEELGTTGLITELAYFSNLNADVGNTTYKIYMSTTDRNVFGPDLANAVWKYFGEQKLVFDGSVNFPSGRNAISIELDQPFYYDADSGQNIIITVIKPLIDNPPSISSPRFFNTQVEGLRTFYAIGYGVDMSEITTQPAAWSTVDPGSIPSIVKSNVKDFGTLTGTALYAGDMQGLEGVIVNISPAEDETYQKEEVTTDDEGNFIVPALLPGYYTLALSKEGYNAHEIDFSISANEEVDLEILLHSAVPVLISGTVKDASSNPVSDAYVNLSGYSSFSTMTNQAGEFVLEAYGDKNYYLEIEHPLYHSTSLDFQSEETDFEIDPFVLDIQAHKPMNVVAELSGTTGVVSWDKPYGLDNESILEWGTHTNHTSWGWGGDEFTAAVRFTPDDLMDMIPEDGKLTHIKTYIQSQSDIHLQVFEGEEAANLIYSHPETISGSGWYTFELSKAISVDVNQELWIGIYFEPGYGDFPIGIDEGPNAPDRKGSMLYENGTWTPMSLTNKNWNIYGIVNTTVDANPLGYHVLRGLKDTDPDTWTDLTPELVTQEEFSDSSLADAPAGVYQYGIIAKYAGEVYSVPSPSNDLLFNVMADVTVKLVPNAGTPGGAYISIQNNENFYEKTLGIEDNQVTIPDVWIGSYDISVQLENYQKIELQDYNITASEELELNLIELKPKPVNLAAEQNEGETTATLSWTVHAEFTDDIEIYPDFEKDNISNYILKDIDGLPTYGYTNFSWPGEEEPMSFMVFNPFATTPPISFDAFSGRRYLVAMAGPHGPADDWLIIPAGNGKLSFHAKSIVGDDPETFRVLYSTTGAEIGDFSLMEDGASISPSDVWTEYVFDAPEGTRYVAINYISDDTYFLMIDDITFQKEYNHALHFNVYLDGMLNAENITETTFEISGLDQANHIAEIEAVYSSGVSDRAEIHLEGSVSVDDLISEECLRVYPNPSTGSFKVYLSSEADLRITNLSGIVVYQGKHDAGETSLNLGLASGTYILRSITGSKIQTQKLIIR